MTVTKNIRVCASCTMWCGQRLLEKTHHLAKAKPNEFGYCSKMRLDKTAQSSCGKWEAWSALK